MSVPVRQFIASSGVPIFYPVDAPGDIGSRGPSTPGPTGPRGPPASGTGTIGPAGPQGLQGFPGPQGPQGSASSTGATGPAGPIGVQGPAGAVAGATGPAGAIGLPGNSVQVANALQVGTSVRSGDTPSQTDPFSRGGAYQIGYYVARCTSAFDKSVVMKMYGQNTSAGTSSTDIISIVGNNRNTSDIQQSSSKVLNPLNFATLRLINGNQGPPAPYQSVQLLSVFPGGGTESWSLSAVPNMVSATPF